MQFVEAPKDLIRKLLVVDPSRRLSVKEALEHEFFQNLSYAKKVFNPRKSFAYAILCVRCIVRIQRLKFTPEPISVDTAASDPYRIKSFRKVNCFCIKINAI